MLLDKLEIEFNEALACKDKTSGAKVTEINRKLRENEDLQVISSQEREVRTTLEDLKDRRKRFGDCNVRKCLALRG